MPVLLEVCIASVDDALTSVAGGADRLELSCALELGGLTPSRGLFAEVRSRVEVPVIAMIRPRPGGFNYSATDFDVMCRDAEAIINSGADGLAFGILTAEGKIDMERCRIIRELCTEREAVFHRAFDVTPDPFEALEQLVALGFRRVMTSGQEESALRGADLIAELIRRAVGRIELLPAAGINSDNVAQLVARTGCNQVHASARGQGVDGSAHGRPQVRFGIMGSPEDRFNRTDPVAVGKLRNALNAIC